MLIPDCSGIKKWPWSGESPNLMGFLAKGFIKLTMVRAHCGSCPKHGQYPAQARKSVSRDTSFRRSHLWVSITRQYCRKPADARVEKSRHYFGAIRYRIVTFA